jgi:hypothetical protein
MSPWNSADGVSINTSSLTYLMEISLDEDHFRALGDFSKPGLEIMLVRSKITSAGASGLAEILGRNQGPTKLHNCAIDYCVLANGRLKSLTPSIVSNRDVLAIAGALKENKGLVELDLRHTILRDEHWDAICDSLKTHPTIQVLNLRGVFARSAEDQLGSVVLKSRIQALVDMLKVNMSIHTIGLHPSYSRHELFRRSVTPYLATNRLRPRVRLAQWRTVPRFWDEYVPILIAFGCFYQGILKLLFYR